MGTGIASKYIPVEITVCANCFHKDVCGDKDYLTENNCHDFANSNEIASLREQLAEVTAERDAAVMDMKYGIDHIGCEVCKKGQNASECNGNGCDFEWRGLRKED